MASEYQSRIYLDKETEDALKWIKYKTGVDIAKTIRAAVSAYPPIRQAKEEVKKQKENGII